MGGWVWLKVLSSFQVLFTLLFYLRKGTFPLKASFFQASYLLSAYHMTGSLLGTRNTE